jgi:hypothetical protein
MDQVSQKTRLNPLNSIVILKFCTILFRDPVCYVGVIQIIGASGWDFKWCEINGHRETPELLIGSG